MSAKDLSMGETYATGKPYPPRSEWVPRIFRREGMFYVVELAEDDDLAEHARLNPGTQRIEDINGNQLWPPRPAIAAGTQRAETAKHGSVPKGCQSGGEAASPNTSHRSTGE